MKKKISGDLSKLTNIPSGLLDKLSNTCAYCISEAIYESKLNGDVVTEVDLGFGELLFKTDSGELKVKFIPSENLELDIKGVMGGGEPTLRNMLEKSLSAKLVDLYKEMI